MVECPRGSGLDRVFGVWGLGNPDASGNPERGSGGMGRGGLLSRRI